MENCSGADEPEDEGQHTGCFRSTTAQFLALLSPPGSVSNNRGSQINKKPCWLHWTLTANTLHVCVCQLCICVYATVLFYVLALTPPGRSSRSIVISFPPTFPNVTHSSQNALEETKLIVAWRGTLLYSDRSSARSSDPLGIRCRGW